jgi:hypothetical protein
MRTSSSYSDFRPLTPSSYTKPQIMTTQTTYSTFFTNPSEKNLKS